VERVYRRNGDQRLVAQCVGPLERFHEWYWRERDVSDLHLATVGAYADEFADETWCSVSSTNQPQENWYKIPVLGRIPSQLRHQRHCG